jgi:hypothetical protein
VPDLAHHLVEYLISEIKQFRRVAVRDDDAATAFSAFAAVATFMVWLGERPEDLA